MTELLFKEECYQIMGACFEVYKELGCGFVESVYQESLEIEMTLQNLPFRPQEQLKLTYKATPLKQFFVPDFVCFGKIILEIKAVTTLNDDFRAKVHNYLKATGYQLGLLVNFGHYPQVQWERIIR
jgi:GxxExxY protein